MGEQPGLGLMTVGGVWGEINPWDAAGGSIRAREAEDFQALQCCKIWPLGQSGWHFLPTLNSLGFSKKIGPKRSAELAPLWLVGKEWGRVCGCGGSPGANALAASTTPTWGEKPGVQTPSLLIRFVFKPVTSQCLFTKTIWKQPEHT